MSVHQTQRQTHKQRQQEALGQDSQPGSRLRGELLGAVCPDGVCGGSRQCERKLWSCRNVTGGLEQQRTVSEATWVMALAP